jgi:hypothetical protein
MGIVSQAVKAYKKAKASKTARGAEKTRMKEEYERQGRSETAAANKANYDMRKAEGKTSALEKAEVKQDRDTSKFVSGKEKGGNKTLAVQARDTGEGGGRAGQMLSMKRPSDEASTVRSVAERQKLRSSGEKMYEAGLTAAAKKDLKRVGAAGAAGAAGIAAAGAGSSKGEDKKATTETKATKEDTRVNPKDYPTYQKKTESAAEFRKAFSKAKDAGKDTFTFEGRTYKTEDGMKGMKMMKGGMSVANKGTGMAKKYAYGGMGTKKMMGGGMAKNYAKGGMANCGASVKASGSSRSK